MCRCIRFVPISVNTRLVLPTCMLLASLAACALANQQALTLQCPTYLVSGYKNEIHYRLMARSSGSITGTLAVFSISAGGRLQQKPLISIPVRLDYGKSARLDLNASALPAVTTRYLVRLTAGKKNEYIAECRTQVKAWDLIGCFINPVTDEEKCQINAEMNNAPEEYSPEMDPFIDDEATNEPDPYPYSAGIDSATVTSKHIAVKVWFLDQKESQARRLCITNGIPSYQISQDDRQNVWGKKQRNKKWYDDQGSALLPDIPRAHRRDCSRA